MNLGSFEKEKNKKLQNFNEILDDLTQISTKEKILWKEIYENAISDRQKAEVCFEDLVHMVINSSNSDLSNHVNAGRNLEGYLLRMEKSNGQLLKLAELISVRKQEEEEAPDPDKFFDSLEQEH